MKKIQIVTLNLGCGGAEKVLINMLNRLDYSLYEVEVLLIENKGIYIDNLNKNVKLRYVFPNISFKNRKLENIYDFIKRNIIKYFGSFVPYINENFDIQIAFLEGLSTIFLSKAFNNSKKIAWVHTDLKKMRSMPYKKELKIYEKFDTTVCVSENVKHSLIELYPTLKEKTKVIYNLIECEKVIELSKENVELKFNKPTIIGVGRLNVAKRFDLLLEAHNLLLKEGIYNELLILGEGNELDNLKSMINNKGLNESIKLLGFKKNPYPYIKKSDVFVMTSDYEGFSLVLAEAMILGKAIVSTKCTGPKELLNYGKCGLLVECNNVIKIKEAIKRILIDTKLKKDLEFKCKIRSNIFNSNEVMKQINELLQY